MEVTSSGRYVELKFLSGEFIFVENGEKRQNSKRRQRNLAGGHLGARGDDDGNDQAKQANGRAENLHDQNLLNKKNLTPRQTGRLNFQ